MDSAWRLLIERGGVMIDYKYEGEFISCWSYSFDKSRDDLIGAIRKDADGFWVFHPARKVTLCCGQLKRLYVKISEMNT